MEWISVKDRVPGENEIVLGYDSHWKVIETAHYTGIIDKDGVPWMVLESTDESRVTHWMPLPEPPKE